MSAGVLVAIPRVRPTVFQIGSALDAEGLR
jgi:hypothetical protein